MFHQTDDNGIARKTEASLKKSSGKSQDSGKSPRSKFRVFGEEMIEKEVKQSGNTGRVYLPLDWVGKRVKVVRID